MTLASTTISETQLDLVSRASSRVLHPSRVTVEADVLSSIASGLGEVTLPWELRTGEVPTERRYERLLITPVYEAWVICWPVGAALDLHDHGGSAGAFAVVAGELQETTIEHGVVSVHRYRAGQTATFGATRVHEVANGGARLATSVHVYSPPLSVMEYYRREADGGLVNARRDPVD
ncbi:MAG: hypothetical protein QOJ74_1320 [Ilumatobacteraceae bacterium]|jgi:hypothetical protein|nr:hypothetical protein [Ilumatobacteraceae bacterium]